MTMAITPAQTGRISGIFWRRPALGLFLLLLGPLMWFGIVYLGSLLTLLWQSIYTFDDFTMSVTSDFTLANLRALFNPANYDIIVRTLVMALCVTLASALLALRQAARQAKTLIANRAVRDGESAGWRAGSAEAAPGPDRRSAG